MRYICLVFLCVIFYFGFFSSIKELKYLVFIKDTYLHFIVFFSYVLFFCVLLPNFKLKTTFIFTLFVFMSYSVEFLQLHFFNRSYSIVDFKYSTLGTFMGTLFYIYIRYLSYAVKASS